MFDHVGIFVSEAEKSIPFFEACLAPLGIEVSERQPEWDSVVFLTKAGEFLWVGPARGEYHGTPVSPEARRPMHLAFTASTREAVDEFHRRGLAQGGRDNGRPEEYDGRLYHAFLLDPDGNNIEAIHRMGKAGSESRA